MKETYIKYKLTSPTTIKGILIAPFNKEERHKFTLATDFNSTETLKIDKVTPLHGGWVYELRSYSEIVLGHNYVVILEGFTAEPLDVSDAINFPDFDEEYSYEGDDLGATYSLNSTTFKLWAPLASDVTISITLDGKNQKIEMERQEKGIYEIKIDGNLNGARYLYHINNNGMVRQAIDPYAKGSTQNGEQSVVVDFSKLKTDFFDKKLPVFKDYTQAIIYETSVRDITSDPLTSIKNKGRYLGLTETGIKTPGDNPIGFDYLASLGVTHIQFLPIYDFKTVDEKDPGRFYNWGYDPWQFMVPEGGFASILEDPFSRIKDVKKMVSSFHSKGLRVVMDVVYNHVYKSHFHPLERIVPGYYFRRLKDGKMSEGSFCGNDVATDRPMARKLLIDASIHWVKEYGIDGFRFDLMGIIDQPTMNQIIKKVREIKPDFMFYGEGWNMPTELPDNVKSSMNNSDHLPEVAFFNDSFREIVKGGTMEDKLLDRGYILGSIPHRLGYKFAYAGSCLDLVFPSKFRHANQSINYVECHDNGTIFDKIEAALPCEDFASRLKRVKLLNAATMLSFGIPFFHMGQEIGLSKNGDTNSYKSGDRVNKFDYRVLDERPELYHYFKQLTLLRKKFKFLQTSSALKIEKIIRFEDLPNGGLLIDYDNVEAISPYKKFIILFNPSTERIFYKLEDYYTVLFAEMGFVDSLDIQVQNLMLDGLSMMVIVRK